VYGIAPDRRRRGFATEAARLTSEWLLTTQAVAVELRIGADHLASQQVATKAGFRASGTVRSIGPSGETYADVRYLFHGG
jgi:RimJ/RimL family protein N-acetyltransferase